MEYRLSLEFRSYKRLLATFDFGPQVEFVFKFKEVELLFKRYMFKNDQIVNNIIIKYNTSWITVECNVSIMAGIPFFNFSSNYFGSVKWTLKDDIYPYSIFTNCYWIFSLISLNCLHVWIIKSILIIFQLKHCWKTKNNGLIMLSN